MKTAADKVTSGVRFILGVAMLRNDDYVGYGPSRTLNNMERDGLIDDRSFLTPVGKQVAEQIQSGPNPVTKKEIDNRRQMQARAGRRGGDGWIRAAMREKPVVVDKRPLLEQALAARGSLARR